MCPFPPPLCCCSPFPRMGQALLVARRSGPDFIKWAALGSAGARRVSLADWERPAGQAAAYSPNGLLIAYTDGKDLFTAKSDGSRISTS